MFSCILVSIERCAAFTLALFYSHRDQSYFYKLTYFFARFSSAGQMKFISYKLLSNSSMRKKNPLKFALLPTCGFITQLVLQDPTRRNRFNCCFSTTSAKNYIHWWRSFLFLGFCSSLISFSFILDWLSNWFYMFTKFDFFLRRRRVFKILLY